MAIDIREYEACLMAMDQAKTADRTAMAQVISDKAFQQQMRDALIYGMGFNHQSIVSGEMGRISGVKVLKSRGEVFSSYGERLEMSGVATEIVDLIESMWREPITKLHKEIENANRREMEEMKARMFEDTSRRLWEVEEDRFRDRLEELKRAKVYPSAINGKRPDLIIHDDLVEQRPEPTKPKKGFPWFFGNKRRW